MNITRLIGGSLAASVLFFLVSNFGVWLNSVTYPKTIAGLLGCYEMAIPFFQNTMFGDLFFVGVLFGGFELLKIAFPKVAVAQ